MDSSLSKQQPPRMLFVVVCVLGSVVTSHGGVVRTSIGLPHPHPLHNRQIIKTQFSRPLRYALHDGPTKELSYSISFEDYQYLKRHKIEGKDSPYNPDPTEPATVLIGHGKKKHEHDKRKVPCPDASLKRSPGLEPESGFSNVPVNVPIQPAPVNLVNVPAPIPLANQPVVDNIVKIPGRPVIENVPLPGSIANVPVPVGNIANVPIPLGNIANIPAQPVINAPPPVVHNIVNVPAPTVFENIASSPAPPVVHELIRELASPVVNNLAEVTEPKHLGSIVEPEIHSLVNAVVEPVLHNLEIPIVQDPLNIESVPVQPVIHKHIYFHVPPPEFEETPAAPRVVLPPKKNYNIVFIKVPSYERSAAQLQQLLRAQAPIEDKTLIYVLSKKQDEAQPVVLQEPRKPSAPEVYFVKYKTPSDIEPINEDLSLPSLLQNVSPVLDRKREARDP